MDDCAPDSVILGKTIYGCERCGTAITEGNLCARCDEKLAVQKFALQRYILPRE